MSVATRDTWTTEESREAGRRNRTDLAHKIFRNDLCKLDAFDFALPKESTRACEIALAVDKGDGRAYIDVVKLSHDDGLIFIARELLTWMRGC